MTLIYNNNQSYWKEAKYSITSHVWVYRTRFYELLFFHENEKSNFMAITSSKAHIFLTLVPKFSIIQIFDSGNPYMQANKKHVEHLTSAVVPLLF